MLAALLGALVLSLLTAFAQVRTVTGVVQDGTGEPLIGATVIVAGADTRDGGVAITDLDGRFSLSATGG